MPFIGLLVFVVAFCTRYYCSLKIIWSTSCGLTVQLWNADSLPFKHSRLAPSGFSAAVPKVFLGKLDRLLSPYGHQYTRCVSQLVRARVIRQNSQFLHMPLIQFWDTLLKGSSTGHHFFTLIIFSWTHSLLDSFSLLCLFSILVPPGITS